MQAEAILRSDILDIIFENRNKQYGAYELRKGYDKRLLTAILLMFAVVVITLILSFIKWKGNGNYDNRGTGWKIDSVVLKSYTEKPVEEKIEKPEKKIATVKNPPPLIVPDNRATDIVPSVDDLDKNQIGLKNIAGDLLGDIVQPPTDDNTGNGNGVAEKPPAPEPEPAVWDKAEFMPEYPGGSEALRRFLGRNLQVPEDALEPGQRVKVPIRFVVNKNGELSDIEFLTDADAPLKNEILRVVKKMPKWKPGSQNGNSVAVYFTIPIIFEIGID